MKRKILTKLKKWKAEAKGETALLVTGARRVGKSYAVEEFAREEYKSYLLIDFSEASEELKDLFRYQMQNLDIFFQLLTELMGVKLYKRESVIVFDEVQSFPRARECIKRLVADGRYDYIETGSLMSIRENTADILIPSEEQEVKMWPMDFEEFTWALGEDMLFDTLRAMLREKHPLGQALHRKIMTLFRLYLITGGMPQAVAKYIDSTDLKQVDQVKRNILALYRNDIIKHGDRNSLKIQQIFDQIPTELSSPNKRFMLTDISSDARMREYEDALLWLMEARLVNLCYNTMEPTVGLAARLDSTMFKCYHADTGLLISQTFAEEVLSRDEIYKKLLFYKLEFNNGMVLENVVAQLLTAAGHDLYYYAEPTDRIEIDFLLTKGQLTSRHNITPIEVKSGKEYMTKSLTRYSEKYARQIGTQYIFHDGDISVDGDVMKLPVYMAGLI